MSVVWVAVGATAAKAVGDHIQGNIQRDAAARKGQTISEGYDLAKEDIAKGKDETMGLLDKAKSLYDPYTKLGTDALGQYGDLLSGEGMSSIYNDPVFKQIQEQTAKQIGQQAAASGKARSGVALSQYYAPAMANLAYKGYYDRLQSFQPALQLGYGATGQQAGIVGSQANLTNTYYGNLAKLNVGQAAGQADMIQEMANADVMRWVSPIQTIGKGIEQYAGYMGYNNGGYNPPVNNGGYSIYGTT